jgi:adenylate cyclase
MQLNAAVLTAAIEFRRGHALPTVQRMGLGKEPLMEPGANRHAPSKVDLPSASREAAGLFAEAERRSERALAWLRLGVFAVLLLGQRVFELVVDRHMFGASLAIYGAATLAALVLAHSRICWAWLGWVLTTLDLALVVHFVAMLVFAEGWSTAEAIGSPGVLMIFVVLAQAALRYRPGLVLYAAGLFLVAWAAFHVLTGEVSLSDPARHWRSGEATFAAIVALTALALFAAATRARRLLVSSIAEARVRATLSRFVPAKLAQEIAASEGALPPQPRTHPVAVLFVDMRGFTAAAEGMRPDEVLAFLNDYRRRVVAPIVENGGVVDKFIGDAVMAVFGVPRAHTRDPVNALRCGLYVLGSIAAWNAERVNHGKSPVRVGIGAHYGEAVVGVIGDAGARLEYTVIGDAVNLAQRAERLAGRMAADMLVTSELIEAAVAIDAEAASRWVPLPPMSVDGRQSVVLFFALKDVPPRPAAARPADRGTPTPKGQAAAGKASVRSNLPADV